MSKKIIVPLVTLLLAGAGTLSLKPCIIPGPICEAHMEKVGAQKDKDNPYYLSFTTPWLAQRAN
ncbi:MAG TPA: hypothetical protein PK011_13865, partial [Marinagarivorans sp.]|nr:hypothetical protein [Marinagarivorans sp.]